MPGRTTMPGPNPFDVYPVTDLKGEGGPISLGTIPTDAIVASRRAVQRFIRGAPLGEPVIVAVKGEYGSGKTHLLRDAAEMLRAELGKTKPCTTVLRTRCLEADVQDWYRNEVGPDLARNPVL